MINFNQDPDKPYGYCTLCKEVLYSEEYARKHTTFTLELGQTTPSMDKLHMCIIQNPTRIQRISNYVYEKFLKVYEDSWIDTVKIFQKENNISDRDLKKALYILCPDYSSEYYAS